MASEKKDVILWVVSYGSSRDPFKTAMAWISVKKKMLRTSLMSRTYLSTKNDKNIYSNLASREI